MTEINTRKFYQFLSNYTNGSAEGQGAAGFIDENYGNSDGYLVKSEFRKFMNAEWNGEENGELTNDLINAFWKKIDTNTSASKISGTKLKNNNALDKNEAANLENKLKLYVEFDNYIKDNVEANIPGDLRTTGSQWVSSVAEELNAKFEEFIAKAPKNADGEPLGMENFLDQFLPTIANKCTAQYCAVEYQEELKDVFADYPEYKVADDATLQKLLDAYIATIGEDASNIYYDIREIMDAYLATAGLKEDASYDLSELGYKEGQLNDLQIEVIKQTIKNELAEEVKNYEGYEDYFNTAVQDFINEQIKKGGTFEELKAAATKFQESEFKTKLDNLVTINTTYKDVVEDSEFYNELVTKFGADLADKIAKNDKYLKFYQDIVTDVINKVNNGDMTMDEVQGYMLEQIAKNLDKFFPNGLGDMSLEELNNMYDQLSAAAEVQEDVDEGLKLHREAAIKYCDALAKKGGKLKEALVDAFGSDYKSAINKMYPGDIQEVMVELKAKVLEIGDVAGMTETEQNALFTGVQDAYTVEQGSKFTFNVPTTGKVGESTITSDRFSFKASGSLTIDEKTGKVTVDSSKVGTYSGTITVYIDGVKVASKTVNITITAGLNSETLSNITTWAGNAPHGVTVMTKPDGNKTGSKISNCSFADLYNNDSVICLGFFQDDDKYNWGQDGKYTCLTRLTNVGTYVVDTIAASNPHINKSLLTQAMQNVVNRYVSTDPYYSKQNDGDTPANFYKYMTTNKEQVKNGLVQVKDADGDDSNVYGFYFREFVDAIIAEYNKLKG